MLQPLIIQRMWISKSTFPIGDMMKQLYFSDSFNQSLYPLPREILPRSHLKTSVDFISVIKKLITEILFCDKPSVFHLYPWIRY